MTYVVCSDMQYMHALSSELVFIKDGRSTVVQTCRPFCMRPCCVLTWTSTVLHAYACRMPSMHAISGNALHIGSKSCLYEFTELNFLSVGSQLPPRTLNVLID